MTEIVTLKGPLDEEQLGWVASLYGPVDEKYASLAYVRHQFVDNPFGWSVHAFVVDDGRPGGHCAAVPFRARTDASELVAGKIEAVVLAEGYRGRRTEDGRSLAVAMLSAMYDAAHEQGIDVLFGLAPPAVAAVHARAGCARVQLDTPTYVLLTHPDAVAATGAARRVAIGLLAVLQRIAVSLASAAGGPRARASAGELAPDDSRSARAARPAPGAWTISGEDAWGWFAGSGLLRAVELPGAAGSRALVRLSDAEAADVQLVAWQPQRASLRAAIVLLAALARLARERGARTLRYQPWHGTTDDEALARACRLLGFARRAETELVVHADGALADAGIELTPFFYVTF